MNIRPLVSAYTGLTPLAKLVVAASVVAVVAIISGSVGGVVSRLKDARFDKAEAARATERTKLEQERDAHLRRAEAAEAKAGILEEQAKAMRQVADSAALTAKQSQARADQIAKETETSVASIGDVAPEVARQEIHDRLVRLGLLKE